MKKREIIKAMLDQIKDITDNQIIIGKEDTFTIEEIEEVLKVEPCKSCKVNGKDNCGNKWCYTNKKEEK